MAGSGHVSVLSAIQKNATLRVRNVTGRFVILEHNHPSLHWDFLLETGPKAATWRLAQCPQPGLSIDAERIADHRLFYLDYEGPVSGGRGEVQRKYQGEWTGDLEAAPLQIELKGSDEFRFAQLAESTDGTATWTFLA